MLSKFNSSRRHAFCCRRCVGASIVIVVKNVAPDTRVHLIFVTIVAVVIVINTIAVIVFLVIEIVIVINGGCIIFVTIILGFILVLIFIILVFIIIIFVQIHFIPFDRYRFHGLDALFFLLFQHHFVAGRVFQIVAAIIIVGGWIQIKRLALARGIVVVIINGIIGATKGNGHHSKERNAEGAAHRPTETLWRLRAGGIVDKSGVERHDVAAGHERHGPDGGLGQNGNEVLQLKEEFDDGAVFVAAFL
mmetsp:Transcript_4944/g.10967  ORF Transcript_4944/g.10967 Transcript_4944/m.10967 type:complete len:248 (-) Transcript_4944:1467-2210(-)